MSRWKGWEAKRALEVTPAQFQVDTQPPREYHSLPSPSHGETAAEVLRGGGRKHTGWGS
jgi:hypothetical protein